MKRLLGVFTLIILFCGISILGSDAATPRRILGASGECDTNNAGCISIPLTVTVKCTVTCAFRTSPSYASATEFWAAANTGTGACRRSIDSGATWPACTAQPFATGANELYAGAADGSVIAVGTTTGPNTCTVRRSTNNATSWTTVFTLVFNCNAGNLEGQRLYCLIDGRCEFVGGASGASRVFRSSDNGQTWAAGETGIAPNCSNAGLAWDGSAGIAPSEATGCGGGNIARAFLATGDVWADSIAWNGTQGDCWGSIIWNGVGHAVCQGASATPDGRYTIRNSVGTNVRSLNLTGAGIAGIDAGGVAVAPFTDTIYIFATRSTDTGIWVTRDDALTFTLIGTLTGTMRGGHAYYANGCVYFTGQASTKFVQIC